jgi:hypothetical protein
MRLRPWLWILAFTLVVMLGYWLAGTAVPRAASSSGSPQPASPRSQAALADEALPRFRRGVRLPGARIDSEALQAGALEGQRVLVFKDQAALSRFLENMGDRVRLLDRLDGLNALRVGFSDDADLLALLTGGEEQSFIFPVNAPPPPEGTVQSGAVALGNRLLDWLGITGDNSDWGKGVRIAVLDTGVVANPAFSTSIHSINLVDLPANPLAQHGHGTGVASMIIGRDSLTPGVAPGADIVSIRIADDNGQSDSFILAKGIVAAIDAGARLINISMGSQGDSIVVRNALDYARAAGALVVAAAGNNGTDQVTYPAANAGVIAVGAVDALGNHLDFSNSGTSIALAAPGYGVNAAWTGGQAMSVTGTSFSTPIVVGAIAAIMTESGPGTLTPTQAYQQLVSYLNDGGEAGKDAALGGGMPDIGRVLNANTPGIHDAAVASSRILAPDAGNPYGQIEVLVQNRGTETLINTAVNVTIGGGVIGTNLTALAPNAVQTIHVPITQPAASYANGIRVEARVVLSGGIKDMKPSNDRRVETYVAAGAP